MLCIERIASLSTPKPSELRLSRKPCSGSMEARPGAAETGAVPCDGERLPRVPGIADSPESSEPRRSSHSSVLSNQSEQR